MVKPEEARKIAELLDNAPYANSCTNDAADALRDLASQVESLQAELAEKTNTETGDMTLEQAMNLGKLWAAGKMIGGDAYAAAAVLAGHMDDMQADAERFRWLRDNSAEQWEHPICVEQFKDGWGMRYVGPLTGKALENKIDEARKQS